jgi:hypothetical protein
MHIINFWQNIEEVYGINGYVCLRPDASKST